MMIMIIWPEWLMHVSMQTDACARSGSMFCACCNAATADKLTRTSMRTGNMDSSPFLDAPGLPRTPTMSPRLTPLCSAMNLSGFSACSDTRRSAMICTRVPSPTRS